MYKFLTENICLTYIYDTSIHRDFSRIIPNQCQCFSRLYAVHVYV